MKILTVCLVIFILGFDFATPQGNKQTNKLLKAIKKNVEKLDKKNENGFNRLNGKLTNVESQNEDAFNNLNGKLTNLQSQNENGFSTLNEELTNIQSQNENGFSTLNGELTNIQSQNENGFNTLNGELTNIQSQIENGFNTLNEKLKNIQSQNEDQFNKSMDKFDEIQLEIKSLPCSIDKNYFDIESGYCYKYVVLTDKERNWNDAKTACEAQKGDLAIINSSEEWQFVKGVLDNTSSGVTQVWLGGSDIASEGNWVWTDGSSVSYTDWRASEPNGGTGQNCLRAVRSWNWQWSDDPCTYTYYALCKIPA